MPKLAHRSKVRRAERAVLLHHGNINLVPLVDILTSIVFFSLLTYTGEQLSQLTAYDLSLPPQVVTAPTPSTSTKQPDLTLLLAVRVENNGIRVEHGGNGTPFRQEIPGTTTASFDQLEQVLNQVHQQFPQNNDVLVVPGDDVNYDNVVKVLERARLARFSGISLGSRARGTQVSSAGEVR
jgi:biopolymer transport protein ExbD